MNFIRVLDAIDQRKLILSAAILSLLGLLDLVGIGIIAMVSSEAFGDGNSLNLGENQFSRFDVESNPTLFVGIAISLFILKSLLTMHLTRKILHFLARRGSSIGSRVNRNFMKQPIGDIEEDSIQKVAFSLTSGVTIITVQVLGSCVVIVSDFSVLLFLCFALFIVDPILLFSTFLFFSLVASILFYSQNMKAKKLGDKSSKTLISTQQSISNTILLLRDLSVRGTLDKFLQEIDIKRHDYSMIQAETNFLPQVGKYVLEVSAMVGILLVGGVQFIRGDAIEALSTVSLLFVAGMRIIPALLRFQNSVLQIQYGLGASQSTYDLIQSYLMFEPRMSKPSQNSNLDFHPRIEFENVTLSYRGRKTPVLLNFNLTIESGEFLGIIGSSGSGKSTLADCIVGVRKPTVGKVSISGFDATVVSMIWPGKIGYVPQEVRLVEGTIRENIFLGIDRDLISESRLRECLFVANIEAMIAELPYGLDTMIQDRGTNFSGGQRQRIGIARALLTSPKILILDEGTSALDLESESLVMDRIIADSKNRTVILISHRPESFSRAGTKIVLGENF
jgi:ABC-type bacteriocin/lantibiotic exporter with double-glycine peptidase domain